MDQLDPRWQWIETTAFADPEPQYIKGQCNHLPDQVVPVVALGDAEVVAHLCLTCDTQLPAEWIEEAS